MKSKTSQALDTQMNPSYNKQWKLNTKRCTVFVSVVKGKIKNVYATNINHLEILLNFLKKEINIKPSTVTNIYENIYKKCNFYISHNNYKNFVKIWS